LVLNVLKNVLVLLTPTIQEGQIAKDETWREMTGALDAKRATGRPKNTMAYFSRKSAHHNTAAAHGSLPIRYHAMMPPPTHGHLSPDVRRPSYHQTYGLKTVRASHEHHELVGTRLTDQHGAIAHSYAQFSIAQNDESELDSMVNAKINIDPYLVVSRMTPQCLNSRQGANGLATA